MTDSASSNRDPQLPAAVHLAIPASIARELPGTVRAELATMPAIRQYAFAHDFQKRSKSLLMAYLCSLIYCHYILLGRWAMSGFMLASLFTAAALGTIWWLIDLVRMPGLVRDYNRELALDVLRTVKAATCGPTPSAHS